MEKNKANMQNKADNKQTKQLEEKLQMLLKWYHGSTTRFINDALAICGNEDDEDYMDKRSVFTAFIAKEMQRMKDVVDVDIEIDTEIAPDHQEQDLEDDEEEYEDDDVCASEEMFIYQDLLADRIAEEARLRVQVAMLNKRIVELEMLNDKAGNDGHKESGE